MADSDTSDSSSGSESEEMTLRRQRLVLKASRQISAARFKALEPIRPDRYVEMDRSRLPRAEPAGTTTMTQPRRPASPPPLEAKP